MSEFRPITKEGYEKLKAKLDQLIKVARPKAIQDLAEARAHGDLSENAEYEAAKHAQSLLETKIKQLQSNIGMSHIVDISQIKEDKIVFGATVTIQHTETEDVFTYQIVGEDESDSDRNKISVTSPIARALIGKHVDDTVVVNAPGGAREFIVLEINYQ
jgi:transcription elongation factor GreA